MSSDSSSSLRERLARLDADQTEKLVTGLQERIDTLRNDTARQLAPIAVLGVGCRFPGAPDAAAFRRLLSEGGDAVSPPPSDRPESEELPIGGYIDAVDRFDAEFFGIRDGEAAQMDPQHRLVLEEAWHALEDAGAAEQSRRPSATGVFLGISTHDYEARLHDIEAGFSPQATTGNAASAAAGRLAHFLDITGPVFAVDTACSSSLVALISACRSLQRGECDMAIAGGVNLLINNAWTRSFAAAGMLSPHHACRTFDAGADGYVRGEGAGFVVLKRLSEARRDGDRVRALVRGGAINHDGRASSLTAPNATAQQALIEAALADAQLLASDVQMVECHGTGTALGDPIEVQALAEAYGPQREAPLLLGAVKTNIGHLEAAAGIAGVIKTILSLETSTLPPTLHQTTPNPRIAWDRLPVQVVDRTQTWPEGTPSRAGVSSFGFSGTNAHVLLEAAEPPLRSNATEVAVLPLSAPDEAGLSRQSAALADWLEHEAIDPWRAAASLAIGRHHFPVRAAVAVADRDAMVAGMREVAAGEAPIPGARGAAPQEEPRIAFLFTGQGSQWVGMGQDLYDDDPLFRATVERCAEIIDPLIGRSLTAVMFHDDAATGLSETQLTQPALFVLEYALAERLVAWGIEPDVMIGHSLGEWVAACRAGVFSLEDALRLVVARGRAMASTPEDGNMAAVFASPQALSELSEELRESVDLAALNAPDECVVSGPAAAVTAVCKALDARGIGSQKLRTSRGFHSRLMDPVLDSFGQSLDSVTLSKPDTELVSNLTGTTDAPFDTGEYWVRHIREPVRFADGLASVAAAGASLLIEIGASPALIGTASRCPAFETQPPVLIPSLRRNQPAKHTLANLLAQLFVAGAPVRWDCIFNPADRVEAPGYVFADDRHWLALAQTSPADGGDASVIANVVTRTSPADTDDPADQRQQMASLLARSLQISMEDAQSDQDFMALGADSLALTEAVAALERRWSIAMPRQALFETLGTPARLIDHAINSASASAQSQTRSAPAPDSSALSATTQPAPASVQESTPPLAAMSAEMTAGVTAFSKSYKEHTRASGDQRREYGQYLADSRAVAGYRRETKAMLYPIVGGKGYGSHMSDADGNDYVDLAMGFGVQLFGHTPSFLADAIVQHVTEHGLFIGPQAHLAGDVARRICRLTGNERVTFCNSGTEAVMTALRLARHTVGRPRIAMFQGSYHGHFDGALAQIGPNGDTMPLAGGTTPGMVGDVLVLDYGDEEGSLEILKQQGDSLAAVIVEPVQGRRPDRQPRAFLQRLREVTRSIGAALIFDEILLGFRVALGGAQEWADVRADIVTYGKIVGGGLPIGLVAGDARFMDALDGGAWSIDDASEPMAERTFFAGTFNKNPLAMANAQAVLAHLEKQGPSLQETLNRCTEEFAERLNAVLAEEEAGISVQHFSSLFRFIGASDLFYNHMIQHGVYVWEGRTCFLSTAHDDQDLDRIEQAVRASIRAMRAHGMLAPKHRHTISEAPAEGARTLPMTPNQAALRLLAAFSPETSAAYNQTLVFDFKGAVDVEALQAALHTVVDRHEALRTTYPEDGASQVVHRRLDPDIQVLEDASNDPASFQAWVDAAALKPMDLENGPMVIARILHVAAVHYRLVLIMPHLITDGWSMQWMALELAKLYNARQAGRPADLSEPVPYHKYVEHTRARAGNAESAAYWTGLYTPMPAPLELPTERQRPTLQTYAGQQAKTRLSRRLRETLEQSARHAACSLFSLCLAAYARMLARLSGQDDIVVAILSAGQPELGAPSLVGYCVSMLPLRINAGSSVSDQALIKKVQQTVTQAMAHRDYPFSQLLKDLKLRRDPSRPPLAAVSFNLDRLDALPVFEGLTTQLDANVQSAVRWDLKWNMRSDTNGLLIEAHYNRDLFAAERVENWLDTYANILEAMSEPSPEACESALSVAFSAEEMANEPVRGVETVADRVAQFAISKPASPAVRDCEGVLGYAELNTCVDALAARLVQAGVQAGDRIAFLLPRGLGPVVTILATARLGATFVPLEQTHPDEHHVHVLDDSNVRVLVAGVDASLPPTRVRVVTWRRDDDATGTSVEPAAVSQDDIAYVLYTSGSTGRPKGVRVSHGALAVYVTGLLERLEIKEPCAFAMVTSFAADLGYTSVLGALWTGGVVHAIDADTAQNPAALQQWMTDTPVDVLKIVPAHLGALLDAPGAGAMLPRQALILGGDILTWRLVDRIQALPGSTCRIFNHYGPAETTVGACMTEALTSLRDIDAVSVPVGPPLPSYSIAIQDPKGQSVPDGEEGEIVISGAAVAAGYTHAETAGEESFVRHTDGKRSYRTGDLGYRRTDGAIVFCGRRDDMVKIRGHRIEPGGLTDLLRGCPGVRDAVVLVERQPGREAALLAAVAGDVVKRDIAAWLEQRVPDAMVPGRIMIYAALPLSANGKIDRQALLSAATESSLSTEPPASLAADERVSDGKLAVMRDLWRAILQREDVGPDDDFFALGGDSIVAIQIVGRARAAGLGLIPAQVFEAPTPRGLAQLAESVEDQVAGAEEVTDPVALTPIQQWFLETPMPNRNRWCLSAVFAAPFTVTQERLRETAETIVARHDALRTALRVDDGGTQCVDAASAVAVWLVDGDGDGLAGGALLEAESQLADQLMDTLDLTTGRVFAVGAIPLKDASETRIVAVVHHAVFDMVSWAILADDLETGLSGDECIVEPALTSWSWWASVTSTRADTVDDRRPYWHTVAQQVSQCALLPLDYPDAPNREGDVQEHRLYLEQPRAERFLSAMAEVFGLRPQEAVLAVVGHGLADWAAGPLAVELEGHGRQPFDKSVDLSRTIGWFTTRYPVVLPAVGAKGSADWAVATKEVLRRIPDEGMSYGLLRYSGHEVLRVEPAVSFNFVGELSGFGGRTISLVRLGAGCERAADAGRRHLLAFDCWQESNALELSCRFAAQHAGSTIEAVLAAIDSTVDRFIQVCEASSSAIYTPSDFTGIDFSQDELDQLIGDIGTHRGFDGR